MDLIAIVALSLILLPLAAFTTGALRIALGLAFGLFFPGYTLIAALFPKKDSLNGIERLALSFGLSIVVVPLIGLILNYTPWGISLYPILVSLPLGQCRGSRVQEVGSTGMGIARDLGVDRTITP